MDQRKFACLNRVNHFAAPLTFTKILNNLYPKHLSQWIRLVISLITYQEKTIDTVYTPTNVVPVNQPLDTDDDVGIEVVAWAKRRGDSWWPAYICDPTTVRKKLKISVLPALAKNVAEIPKPAQRLLTLHELKPEDDDMSNKFDDEDEDEVPVDKTTILPVEVVAWEYLAADEATRTLPFLTNSEMILERDADEETRLSLDGTGNRRGRLVSIAPATASNASIAPTSTASGVDPTDGTNEAFSNEGDVHQGMLAKAKADPEVRLVFFFGLYNLYVSSVDICIGPLTKILSSGLVKVNGRIPNLKVWKCREYKIFEQGFPVGTMQGTSVAATFYIAIQEAQEFVTKDENSRVLPRMVPSDMNPQLEPPRAETTEQANDEVDNTCDLAAVNTFVPKKRQQILPNIPFGQVVWSKPSRSPWWPVYVIDPSKLRHNLYHLGKK
ncbi:hypothetical protein DYB32_001403 [Aphanomyces invadans]|uniref:PWWP domain-containing protein n=1 Tax=Aphanomyces invadans TaxID=157072 RepID=A0A418B6K9_9STRA|nr:hypothetical protein DYB32_001403 [Aphanomyces invadans]